MSERRDRKPRSVIYLMRHGRAAPPGVLAGRRDYPLTPEGEIQIRAWAEFFAPIPLGAVWCSPLVRARQSAQIIIQALERPPLEENFFIEPAFTEISLGDWEGLTSAEARRKYPGEWEKRGRDFLGFAPPGGESFTDLAARAVPALRGLYASIIPHRHVLIMAHQAVNRSLLAALGQPWRGSWLDIPQDCAALNELTLERKSSGAWNCNILRVNARAPLWRR